MLSKFHHTLLRNSLTSENIVIMSRKHFEDVDRRLFKAYMLLCLCGNSQKQKRTFLPWSTALQTLKYFVLEIECKIFKLTLEMIVSPFSLYNWIRKIKCIFSIINFLNKSKIFLKVFGPILIRIKVIAYSN